MQSFKHHFIIAMPSLKDGYFERSVTYICEHNKEGAMGLIINQAIDLSVKGLLEKMEIDTSNKSFEKQIPVHAGGPVSPERGFVLHRSEQGWRNSTPLPGDLMLTTSKDILESIGTDLGPEEYLLTLGYAGWDAGQLEQEVLDNSWLILPADEDLLFNTL